MSFLTNWSIPKEDELVHGHILSQGTYPKENQLSPESTLRLLETIYKKV